MATSVSVSDSTKAAIKPKKHRLHRPSTFPDPFMTPKQAEAFGDSVRGEWDRKDIIRLDQQLRAAKIKAEELMKKASVEGSAPSVNEASLKAQKKARDAESELNLALKSTKGYGAPPPDTYDPWGEKARKRKGPRAPWDTSK